MMPGLPDPAATGESETGNSIGNVGATFDESTDGGVFQDDPAMQALALERQQVIEREKAIEQRLARLECLSVPFQPT
jgi:hypothetical protein